MKLQEISLEEITHNYQFYWACQLSVQKGIFYSPAEIRNLPKSAGNERHGRLAQTAKWKKKTLAVSSASWESSHFSPEAAGREQLSCFLSQSVWFGVGCSLEQPKHEQGVISEQLMSLPEQIAWREPQWLALILKPSLAQINPLQPGGQRKLLIFTHLFIFRQKIKQLGTAMPVVRLLQTCESLQGFSAEASLDMELGWWTFSIRVCFLNEAKLCLERKQTGFLGWSHQEPSFWWKQEVPVEFVFL